MKDLFITSLLGALIGLILSGCALWEEKHRGPDAEMQTLFDEVELEIKELMKKKGVKE